MLRLFSPADNEKRLPLLSIFREGFGARVLARTTAVVRVGVGSRTPLDLRGPAGGAVGSVLLSGWVIALRCGIVQRSVLIRQLRGGPIGASPHPGRCI